MATNSLDKNKIKFLLLEGIHTSAVDVIRAAGYTQIETVSGALPDEELKRKIADVHFLGIRSRTQLTAKVIEQAGKLTAIGAFCIGTNQIDLRAAMPVSEAFELFGRVENVFDKDYQTAAGYASPGRGAFVGVRARM